METKSDYALWINGESQGTTPVVSKGAGSYEITITQEAFYEIEVEFGMGTGMVEINGRELVSVNTIWGSYTKWGWVSCADRGRIRPLMAGEKLKIRNAIKIELKEAITNR